MSSRVKVLISVAFALALAGIVAKAHGVLTSYDYIIEHPSPQLFTAAPRSSSGFSPFSGADAQTIIQSAANQNPKAILIKAGTYPLYSDFNPVSNLTIDGENDQTILARPDNTSYRNSMIFGSVNNFKIRNMRLEGNFPNNSTSAPGIILTGGSNNVVSGLFIHNMRGQAIASSSQNIVVSNNTCFWDYPVDVPGADGIFLTAVFNALLDNNKIINAPDTGIAVTTSDSAMPSQQVTLLKNYLHGCSISILLARDCDLINILRTTVNSTRPPVGGAGGQAVWLSQWQAGFGAPRNVNIEQGCVFKDSAIGVEIDKLSENISIGSDTVFENVQEPVKYD